MINNLTEADLVMFRKIGVPPEHLQAAQISRLTDSEAHEYGFPYEGDMSGIVFPYRDPITGYRVTARLRRDHPDVDANGKIDKKYVCPPGDNPHLFFGPNAGPLLEDVSVPVLIVEAEKSGLAITALADRSARKLLAIGTGGCWGWRGKTGTETGANGEREQARGPLPDLSRMNWDGRKAYIVFDSNVRTNLKVGAAREALARDLSARGASVYVVDIPPGPSVNGPDDFIAAHQDAALLELIDTAREWRPAITVVVGEAPRAVDEAEKVLVANAERLRIFQRSGEVVRAITLARTKKSYGLTREPGTVQLAPLNQVALTETFERLISWQKFRKVKGGFEMVPADCPPKVAAAYLSRIGQWRLPVLTGVISAPILRPNGTVICRSGYDDETGLYLTEDWPDLNGSPSLADAREALAILRRPFDEFPFIAKEDESVLLAAILTAIQRRLLPTAPLFGFTAPTPRTGKSLLAESVAILATGKPAPAMAVSGDREEMRKAVHAVLREGHQIVNLDNIEAPLGSPYLSMALTQCEYGDRLLGETKTLRHSTNVTWTATGNNLAFRGDLAVRTLLSRLDAQMERPEERRFVVEDLKPHITEFRHDLVRAALTILRAHLVAGRPRPNQPLRPWGGFDEWSRTIRLPLMWLGVPDPCLTRQHVIEDDPDREQAANLLSAWHAKIGDKFVQTSDVVDAATDAKELRTALLCVAASEKERNVIDPRRLSRWCRKQRGQVVNSLYPGSGQRSQRQGHMEGAPSFRPDGQNGQNGQNG